MYGIACSPPTLRIFLEILTNAVVASHLSTTLSQSTLFFFLTTINRIALLFKCIYYKNEMRGDAQRNENVPCLPPQLILHEVSFSWVVGLCDYWKRLLVIFFQLNLTLISSGTNAVLWAQPPLLDLLYLIPGILYGSIPPWELRRWRRYYYFLRSFLPGSFSYHFLPLSKFWTPVWHLE